MVYGNITTITYVKCANIITQKIYNIFQEYLIIIQKIQIIFYEYPNKKSCLCLRSPYQEAPFENEITEYYNEIITDTTQLLWDSATSNIITIVCTSCQKYFKNCHKIHTSQTVFHSKSNKQMSFCKRKMLQCDFNSTYLNQT